MIEIIPAIDIIDGKCVRLSQGDYAQKTIYNENPLEVAKEFEDAGINRLHLVDLDGAKAQHIVNYKVLERIASKTKLVVDFGGGLKSDQDLEIAFESGAEMITGGSIAVKKPKRFLDWLQQYGAMRIILGADVNNGKIAVSGWQEESDKDIMSFIDNYVNEGVKKVISTDISKDGMLTGPAFDLYNEILDEHPHLHLIASGGISTFDDIIKLDEDEIPAVIVGKAIYENRISLEQIEKYIVENA